VSSLKGTLLPATSPVVVATFFTTEDGTIRWADAGGARLLNLSAKGCLGRNLVTSFAQDRMDVIQAMHAAISGSVVRGEGFIRPLNRRLCPVVFKVMPDPDTEELLKWVFEVDDGALSPIGRPEYLRLVHSARRPL
jgi:hypothetical protein